MDLFSKKGRHINKDKYYMSPSYFHLPKNTIRDIFDTYTLIKQTLRDIILLFQDIAGLDMNLQEWKQLCRKAWEKDFDFLQRDRFARIGVVGTLSEVVKKLFIQNAPLKQNLFDLMSVKCCIQLKTEKLSKI